MQKYLSTNMRRSLMLPIAALTTFSVLTSSALADRVDPRVSRYQKEQTLRDSLYAADNPARYVPPPFDPALLQPPAPAVQNYPASGIVPQHATQQQQAVQQRDELVRQQREQQLQQQQYAAEQRANQQAQRQQSARQRSSRSQQPPPDDSKVALNPDGSVRVNSGNDAIDRSAEQVINRKVQNVIRSFGF